MKKLDKLIFTYFLPTFIVTFCISLFVIVCQFLYVWMDEIIGKGLDWFTIFEFLFFLISYKIPMALPLAILLASLMTYGNLGEQYELAVIRSSGISLLRAMRGHFIFILFTCFTAFLISNYYLPYSALKVRVLLHDIRDKAPAFAIEQHAFYDEIEGFSIRVGEKSEDNKTVNDVMIYDHRGGKANTNVLKAKRGVFKNYPKQNILIFELEDGRQYEEVRKKSKGRKKYEHNRIRFESWEKTFDMSSFSFESTNENFFKNSHSMLTLSQLNYAIDSIKKTPSKEAKRLAKSNNNYFTYRSLLLDSINSRPILDSTRDTSYLSKFPVAEQSRIINKALGTCRNVKSTAGFFAQRLQSVERDVRLHTIEWHRKFTLAISCLIFFLVGAPLGAVIRKGGFGLPFLVTIVMYIIFHVLSTVGEKMAKDGTIEAGWGMWLPILVYLPMGLFLAYRVTLDKHVQLPKIFKKR